MQKFIHTNNSLKNLIFENQKYNLSNYKKFLINENNNYIDALTTFLKHVNNQNFKHYVTKCYEDNNETDVFFVLNMLIAGFLQFNNHTQEFGIYEQFQKTLDENKKILFNYIMYDYFILKRQIIEIDSRNSIKINKGAFDAEVFEKQVKCENLASSQYTDKDGIKKAKLSDEYIVTQNDLDRMEDYLNSKNEYTELIFFIKTCLNEVIQKQGEAAEADETEDGDGAQEGEAAEADETEDGDGAEDGGAQEGEAAEADETEDGDGAEDGGAKGGGAQGGGAQIKKVGNDETFKKIKDVLSDKIEDNISIFNNSIIGKFDKLINLNIDDLIGLINNELYENKKNINKNILNENSQLKYKKLNIEKLFHHFCKYKYKASDENNIKNKINDRIISIYNKKIKEKYKFYNNKNKYLDYIFESIYLATGIEKKQAQFLFENIKLNENKNIFSFNNFQKLVNITKIIFGNITVDLNFLNDTSYNKFFNLNKKIIESIEKIRWDLFYLVAKSELFCKSILENKDELLKAGIKIVGQLPDPGVQSKNASVVSSVLSSKIKTKLGKDKRDITDQDIQRELEESVADICLGILRMYDGETYNKYQKSIDDDIVAQYNQGDGWYKRGFEKLFNVGDVTKRVRHETTHKTSEQVKTRLLQQEVKKIIEAFIALTKTVKPDLQQDHKLFTGNIINENNLIYKQFKLLIEQEKDESQEDTEEKETEAEEKETDESTEQETDDTKSDYKISVAKLKQVLQANGVLIYGKSAQNIDAKTRKESEHYMLEMFSSFLSINFDIEVTGVKKYKYDDLIRDQIIAAGNINTQPKEGQVASERIEKLTKGSGLPTKIGDITLEQLVSLLNAAGNTDKLIELIKSGGSEQIIKVLTQSQDVRKEHQKQRRNLPNLSKTMTDVLFNPKNVNKIKDKLNNTYTFKDDHFNIGELQKFFNIIEEGSILFDENLIKNKFIEFTKQFLHIKGDSHKRYDGFVRDEIGCNILNKVFEKASFGNKISTDFINKLKSCKNKNKLINLVGNTCYDTNEKHSDGEVDIAKTKNAIQTQFEKDTKLDDLTLEASKKMSSGLILREGVRVSSVDEVMREFGELKREFRNIYRY